MSLLQFFLSGLSGIALFMFAFNLHMAWRNRQVMYLAFALACFGMVIYIPCNVILYQTTSPVNYVNIVQVQMYGTALFFIGLLWYSAYHLHFPSRLPVYVYSAAFGCFIIARHLQPMLMFAEFKEMQEFVLAWGEKIWLPISTSSLLGNLYVLLIFSVYPVATWMSIRQYRRGYRTEALQLLQAVAILFVITLHDALVYSLGLRWLFLAEVGLVLPLALLEMAISENLLHANRLAAEVRQLNAELEQRVKERTAQLESANKELEAFSYSVSHDLRAPLRAMNGFSRILMEDFAAGLSPDAGRFLQKIVDSGNKMESLIEALLGFSQFGRRNLARQAVDIAPLVRAVIETLAPETAGRQIEWVLGDLPPTNADPLLLQQVYANLLGNAVKYSRIREQARIEIGSFSHNRQAVYFVRDNGKGFNMQYADRL
ncbi:MAG: hypothetical protein EHM81_06875, partial [Chloroflexi bacterium]